MPKVQMPVSDEIDKDISEMLAAFQLGKVDMMHKYYSDNAVFVSGAFAPPIVGWQNYVEDYKRSLAAFQGMQLIRRNTDVFVHGDIAWASYQWEFLSSYQNALLSARADDSDPAESRRRLADRTQPHFAGLRSGTGTTTAAITGAVAASGTEPGCTRTCKTAAIAAPRISGTRRSPRARPRLTAMRQTRS